MKLKSTKSIIVLMLLTVIFNVVLSSCNQGPKYTGRYELCGFGTLAFYLNADGSCSNGLGSTNGGVYGNWQKTSDGIIISNMGSEWDGDYKLDGTKDGVALKKGNFRYCNPSYR